MFAQKDEEFFSKAINESNIDPEKFPASKMRQLAKKMESSKSATRHIKQVASDLQAAQIILIGIKEQTSHKVRASGNNIPTGPDKKSEEALK